MGNGSTAPRTRTRTPAPAPAPARRRPGSFHPCWTTHMGSNGQEISWIGWPCWWPIAAQYLRKCGRMACAAQWEAPSNADIGFSRGPWPRGSQTEQALTAAVQQDSSASFRCALDTGGRVRDGGSSWTTIQRGAMRLCLARGCPRRITVLCLLAVQEQRAWPLEPWPRCSRLHYILTSWQKSARTTRGREVGGGNHRGRGSRDAFMSMSRAGGSWICSQLPSCRGYCPGPLHSMTPPIDKRTCKACCQICLPGLPSDSDWTITENHLVHGSN